MKINIKSSTGFSTADAIIGISIFMTLSIVVIALLFNLYNTNMSNHKLAMATNYAVEILENAKILGYNDSRLRAGNYEGNEILGVNLPENYIAKLNVIDYNKLQENTQKRDLIKILEVNIEYEDGNLVKNIKIRTLKLNK